MTQLIKPYGGQLVDLMVPARQLDNRRQYANRLPSVRPWQHVLEPLSGYLWLGAQLLRGMQPRLFYPRTGSQFNLFRQIGHTIGDKKT